MLEIMYAHVYLFLAGIWNARCLNGVFASWRHSCQRWLVELLLTGQKEQELYHLLLGSAWEMVGHPCTMVLGRVYEARQSDAMNGEYHYKSLYQVVDKRTGEVVFSGISEDGLIFRGDIRAEIICNEAIRHCDLGVITELDPDAEEEDGELTLGGIPFEPIEEDIPNRMR